MDSVYIKSIWDKYDSVFKMVYRYRGQEYTVTDAWSGRVQVDPVIEQHRKAQAEIDRKLDAEKKIIEKNQIKFRKGIDN